MLAINTQLSGLIMWNCGKFTWGSGTNDIRVWPCFSEMAPAPAAGTRRLPKKIWSHFVLLDASPSSRNPSPPLTHFLPRPSPFPISLSLFPFPSHFALKFVNLLIPPLLLHFFFSFFYTFFCFSRTFFSRRKKGLPQSHPITTSGGESQSSRLLYNHYISSFATCVTPEQ